MSENVRQVLPYITGMLFVLALSLLWFSLRLFRRSRTDVFWRRRRDAGQRGWRALVVSFLLIVLSSAACLITVMATLVNDNTSTPTPIAQNPTLLPNETPTVSETPATAFPTATPPPAITWTHEAPVTVIVIITTTPENTPTETPFPTFTPIMTPLVSDVTPLPNASLRITALDDQISDSLTPVNPRAAFLAGTTRIYLFVEFTGMAQGVLWKRELYRNGELIDGNAYLWGMETEGTGYFFFGNDAGFAPGDYEIRLYIGSDPAPINIASFTIVEIP